MTITPWTIYLITLLGDVRVAAGLLTSVGAAVVVLQVLYACLCYDVAMNNGTVIEKLKEMKGFFKKVVAGTAVCGAITILVPSSTTLAAMYVLPAVVNSELVQELPGELVELARGYVKNLIEEQKK